MKRGVAQLVLAFLLLLVGGAAYLLFRPETTLLFCVLAKVGFSEALHSIRAATEFGMPYWMVYCLPGALWVGAYILITDTVLTGWPLRNKISAASLIMAVGVVSELLQLAAVLPGTFDAADIAAYVAPYLLYVTLIITKNKTVMS